MYTKLLLCTVLISSTLSIIPGQAPSPGTPPRPSNIKTQKKIQPSAGTQKHITITNTITDQMLTYKHWTGKYKPTTFNMIVDGTPIAPGEQLKINPKDKKLHIRYEYSFMNGYKTGAHEVVCLIKSNNIPLSIDFSWNGTHHLDIENATIISDEKVPYPKKKVSKRKKPNK